MRRLCNLSWTFLFLEATVSALIELVRLALTLMFYCHFVLVMSK